MSLSHDEYLRKNQKIALMAERAGVAWESGYLTIEEWEEIPHQMRKDIFTMLSEATREMAKKKIQQLARRADVPIGSEEAAW